MMGPVNMHTDAPTGSPVMGTDYSLQEQVYNITHGSGGGRRFQRTGGMISLTDKRQVSTKALGAKGGLSLLGAALYCQGHIHIHPSLAH